MGGQGERKRVREGTRGREGERVLAHTRTSVLNVGACSEGALICKTCGKRAL